MIATSSPFAPPLHEQQRRIFRSISLVCRQWHIIAQEFLYNRLWVNYPKDFETLLECVADPEELDKLFAPGEGAAGMGWSSRDNSPSGRSPGRRSLDDMIPPGLLIRSAYLQLRR